MSALRFAPPPGQACARRSCHSFRGYDNAGRATRGVVPRGWRDDSPLVVEVGADTTKRGKRSKKKKDTGPEQVTGVGKGDASTATLTKIDLGNGKFVELFVPVDVADVQGAVTQATLDQFRDELYGAGDVVWPASVALARLIAHCPSLVKGKRVLELGTGLGLCGNIALKAGAVEVVMADVDTDTLALAKRSASANNPADPTTASTLKLDWTSVPDEFCVDTQQKFDVIIAADVLYDETSARCVADVLNKALKSGGMCLVSDPLQRPHRETFADALLKLGLECVDAEFPGHDGMRLLQVTRVEIGKGG